MFPTSANIQRIVSDVQSNVEAAIKNINLNIMPQAPVLSTTGCPLSPPSSSSSSSAAAGRPSVPVIPRDDEILVDMYNQPIKSNFALKRKVTLKTYCGAIKATITPSPTPSSEFIRTLTTQSMTGAQHITIASSLGPFLLDSAHSTGSGAIKLYYPDDWCGTIELTLTHGSYDLGDATVVRDVVTMPTYERSVLALRGNPREGEEFSTMKISAKTGCVSVCFQKVPPLRDLTPAEIRAEAEAREREMRDAPTQPPPPSKLRKEKDGAPVVRAAVAVEETVEETAATGREEVQAPPQQARRTADLPPSYEQSEIEAVQIQIAGRD